MTTPIPFTHTPDNITLIVDGSPITVRRGTLQFTGIARELLKEEPDWDAIRGQLTQTAALAHWLTGTPFVLDGTNIMLNGQALPYELQQRVRDIAKAGEKSPLPLLRFWERLQRNPSYRSVQQLYSFLQNTNIPIEEDGTFLVYKKVNDELKDYHSETFDNSPGNIHEMPRNQISDDPEKACHVGFHVGALGYVKRFGDGISDSNIGDGVIVICRVDPEHVVCVPNDYSWQKIRVCRYEVIGFYTAPMPSTTVDRSYTDEEANELRTAIDSLKTDEDDDEDDDDLDDSDEDDEGLDDEDDEDEDDDEDEHEFAPAVDHREPVRKAKKAKRGKPSKGKLQRMAHEDAKKLMERSIDDLRGYASKLKMVGASKMAGGKTALVAAIMKYRRKAK